MRKNFTFTSAEENRGSSRLFEQHNNDPELAKVLAEFENEHSSKQDNSSSSEAALENKSGLVKTGTKRPEQPSRYLSHLKEAAIYRDAEREIVYERALVAKQSPASLTFVTSGYQRRLAERAAAAAKLAEREDGHAAKKLRLVAQEQIAKSTPSVTQPSQPTSQPSPSQPIPPPVEEEEEKKASIDLPPEQESVEPREARVAAARARYLERKAAK